MRTLLDLFFPRRCMFCGQLMKEDGEVCAVCEKRLPYLEEPLCQHQMGAVDRLYCALWYDGKVPQGIYHLKFRGKSHVHHWFAETMVKAMGKELREENIDLVTCVPMHRKRQRRRGYNQAQLLARDVAYLLDIPYEDCLSKTKLTREQHRLSGKERMLRQKGSYSCSPFRGERVLLIDDVCTSGETMKECARVLKEAGASAVIGAAACRTPKEPTLPVDAERDLWYS